MKEELNANSVSDISSDSCEDQQKTSNGAEKEQDNTKEKKTPENISVEEKSVNRNAEDDRIDTLLGGKSTLIDIIALYCPICDEISQQNLKRGSKCATCDGPFLYQCKECKVRFERKFSAMKHTCNKRINLSNKCPHCEILFSTKYTLAKHIEHMHTRQHCAKCKNIQKNRSRHCKVVCEEHDKPHKCPKCDFRSSHLHILKVHLRSCHRSATPACNFTCNKCSKSYLLRSRYKKHLAMCCGKVCSLFRCDHCDYETSAKSEIVQHISICHTVIQVEVNRKGPKMNKKK